MTFSYPEYLKSKRTVDDRARHPGVWDAFLGRLRETGRGASRRGEPVRILEVGGGVGDLAIKTLRALPETAVEYTMVDIEPENLEAARERFHRAFPEATVYPVLDGIENVESVSALSESGGSMNRRLAIYLVCDDITRLDGADSAAASIEERTESYDAVSGQAIMDIVPARILLQKLSSLLPGQGVIYLPIHFDGRTDVEPPYNGAVDQLVSDIYHGSMTRTWKDGNGDAHTYDGSRSGRDLVMHAASANLSIVEAGASDWIVLPSDRREGRDAESIKQSPISTPESAKTPGGEHYPAQEAYFIECMLHFIEGELAASDQITAEVADAWLAARRQQLADGDLAMFVHNLDVLLTPAN